MKHFLIYTVEGFTESPTLEPVENCQILGEIDAETSDSAIRSLFERDTWIEKIGFSKNSAVAREIVD